MFDQNPIGPITKANIAELLGYHQKEEYMMKNT